MNAPVREKHIQHSSRSCGVCSDWCRAQRNYLTQNLEGICMQLHEAKAVERARA